MLNGIVWNRTDYLYKNGLKLKESEKKDKYLDLARELKNCGI